MSAFKTRAFQRWAIKVGVTDVAELDPRPDTHRAGFAGFIGGETMSRMTKEALETMRDLQEIGVVSKQTLRDFEAQAVPPPTYTAEAIRRLREQLRLSQAVFAAYLNASVSTVQKWESGEKKPSGAALRLLSVIERWGLEILVT